MRLIGLRNRAEVRMTATTGPGASEIPRPEGLPPFAALGVVGIDEQPENPWWGDELAVLHPAAVAKRRETFRMGRSAAHRALQTLEADTQPILAGPLRDPRWPDGIVGSISHTDDVGMAIVAPADETDGVGIDIERRRDAPELVGQVLRPEELAWIDDRPADQRSDLVMAVFSAKETIFKAFFPRVRAFFGFEAASLEPLDGGFLARLVIDLDSDYPHDRSFPVRSRWGPEHVVSWLVLPKTPHTT